MSDKFKHFQCDDRLRRKRNGIFMPEAAQERKGIRRGSHAGLGGDEVVGYPVGSFAQKLFSGEVEIRIAF
jgi:hypothetical protein